VSFSLDSLDAANFKKITGRGRIETVLESIEVAREMGLNPVKVNAVMIRGINDHEIESLAEFAVRKHLVMRYIEFMPLDSGRAWHRELVVPGREILERLRARYTLEPVAPGSESETARRWSLGGGQAEIGIIAPVSEPFCEQCNRIRLTADGKIRTCLFSMIEHDVRGLLRAQAGGEEIGAFLRRVVLQKEERHHIGERDFVQPARTMSCIGG
jgi:cyclic pyranopterin phosphate synthase